MNIKPYLSYLLTALAGSLLTLGFIGLRPDAEARKDSETKATVMPAQSGILLSPAQLAANGIQIDVATAAPLAGRLALPGQLTLDGDHEARVLTPISGTVREIRAQTGAQVSQGSVLAVLESRELADANALYLAARERQVLAAAMFTREESLWRKKISAEQDYLMARKSLAEADIELRGALQKLLALGIAEREAMRLRGDEPLARYLLRAPVSGTVLSRDLTQGEAVVAGKPVFHLANLHTLWVDLVVPSQTLPLIRTSQAVQIHDTASALQGMGHVLFILPELDNTSRAGSIRVAIDNPTGQWRAGMAVSAELSTGQQTAVISVPASAIQLLDNNPTVFILGKSGFMPRTVVLGPKVADRVEISAGLAQGERYATGASFILKSAWLSRGGNHED